MSDDNKTPARSPTEAADDATNLREKGRDLAARIDEVLAMPARHSVHAAFALLRDVRATLAETIAAEDAAPLAFTYRNWRGETATRSVRPIGVRFGSSQWHRTPQWLLRAFDLNKNEEREFALSGMSPPPEIEPVGCQLFIAYCHGSGDEKPFVSIEAISDGKLHGRIEVGAAGYADALMNGGPVDASFDTRKYPYPRVSIGKRNA